jgi:chemotaxis protein CheC
LCKSRRSKWNFKSDRTIGEEILNKQRAKLSIVSRGNEKVSDHDVLLEVGNIGAGHATIALSTMLHEQVNVEVPRLHIKQSHLVPLIYEKHDTPVAAVFMQLRENSDCDLMLIFEREEAKKIGDLMTCGIESDQNVEESAIEEVGSIMICSFLNAVADFTSTELLPTPPQLIYDSFDAVIDSLLAKQALSSDVAAIFARFKRSTSSAEGYLIMFPRGKLQKLIARKGKELLKKASRSKTANSLPFNFITNEKLLQNI